MISLPVKKEHLLKGISFSIFDEGYIDRSGKMVIPLENGYSNLQGKFNSGRILKELDSKYGYIDANNVLVIPHLYEEASAFAYGTAIVGKKDLYDTNTLFGLINTNGDTLLPFRYEKISRVRDSLFIAKYYSETQIDTFQYRYTFFSGVINAHHDTLIHFEYDSIKNEYHTYWNEENYFMCNKRESGWRIVELGSSKETGCCYEEARQLRYGYAPVRKGKWGLVDSLGQEKIPYEYDEVILLSRTRAGVRKGDKWSYWKTDGTKLTDFLYDEIIRFRFGLSYARNGTKSYIYDEDLKIQLENFTETENFKLDPVQGLNTLMFYQNGKFGLKNRKGEILFPAKSDEPILFGEDW
ncbi:MAG: WG repeat-containing protein [Cytophagaceae bacterium]|nr:WG repeat-containing protein [Cytophagaceae bacterium]